MASRRKTWIPLTASHSKCEDGDPRLSTETLFERKNRLEKEHRQARRRSAQNDPGVQNVTQLLNAEIIDVQLSPNDTYTR